MALHERITFRGGATILADELLAAAEECEMGMTDSGFCIRCGMHVMHVEPDAEKYRCPACDRLSVYGATRLLLAVAG